MAEQKVAKAAKKEEGKKTTTNCSMARFHCALCPANGQDLRRRRGFWDASPPSAATVLLLIPESTADEARSLMKGTRIEEFYRSSQRTQRGRKAATKGFNRRKLRKQRMKTKEYSHPFLCSLCFLLFEFLVRKTRFYVFAMQRK